MDDLLKVKDFKKRIGLYLSNNIKLAKRLLLDGVYLPAFNKNLSFNNLDLPQNFKIIGSAHNVSEIKIKENRIAMKYF